MSNFDKPVLFIIFNRPDQTAVVFEEIRKARPSQLFVAADGPRAHVAADGARCVMTRAIIDGVDWPCEVKTLFREENLGCRVAVSDAIDWFFDQVEEGVILEDDCVPSVSFFIFCADMLDRYRDDARVMQVSGANILRVWKEDRQDYSFSYYGGIWGWATWRRAWKYYDVHIKAWADPAVRQALADVLVDRGQFEKRVKTCELVYQGKVNTWDYQWTFCKLINSGLTVTPSRNLVSNIGFHADATHTISDSGLSNIARYEMEFPLRANNFVVPDRAFDAQFFRQAGEPFLTRLKGKLRSMLFFLSKT